MFWLRQAEEKSLTKKTHLLGAGQETWAPDYHFLSVRSFNVQKKDEPISKSLSSFQNFGQVEKFMTWTAASEMRIKEQGRIGDMAW